MMSITAALLLLSSILPMTTAASAKDSPEVQPDLVDVALQAGAFSTLATALTSAGLVDTLRSSGPFTVFAPTDAAFAKLPEGLLETLLEPANRDRLAEILTYHVVAGRVGATEALNAGSAATVQGSEIGFSIVDGGLRVGDARVVQNDISARNGIIHVIDQVLIPPQPESSSAARGTLAVAGILELAIARGVPLFNDGQPEACAAIYEVACQSVLALDLPEAERVRLRAVLDAGARMGDPVDRAWAYRGAMDAVFVALAQGSDGPGADADAGNLVVFDFEPSSGEADWPSVNDDVMGGISQSVFRMTTQGTAVFAGALSLENNGGFATVRSPEKDLELGGFDGLTIRVRGDGRSYNLSALGGDSRREVHIWKHSFETVADEWVEVSVPFSELEHRVMGWRISDKAIDPADIRSLALGISDKDETPFALEIDWVRAWVGAP
ncbi:MAG: putative surface protein with fasciclin (FAS1) repeats [Pseudohongiellaceae bacterium]|jgi:uncharacterized surface protein with fasciclin (FAS1) repeats